MKKVIILFIALLGILYGKPSWCNNAKTNIEKLICNSTELSEYESKLVKVYRHIKKNVSNEQKKTLLKTQRQWIKHRNKICKSDTCLKKSYINRITALKDTYLKRNSINSDIELRFRGEKKQIIEFGGYSTPLCSLELKASTTKILNNCRKFTNSKGIKIICNSNKSVCKTEKELFEFAKKSSNKQRLSIGTFKNLNELYKYNQKIEKNINTYRQKGFENSNIITMINSKHKENIDIFFTNTTFHISYSKKDTSLKIWDKLTNKLLKTYRNLNNIDKIYQYSNSLYFWNVFTLYQINLTNLEIKKLLDNTRPIGEIYFLSNYLMGSVNSSLGAKYNSAINLRIDLKNNKVYKNTIFECPWTNCNYNSFFLNLDRNAFYIHVNDKYYKLRNKYNDKKEIYKNEFESNNYFTNIIRENFQTYTNTIDYDMNTFVDSEKSKIIKFDDKSTQSDNYINVINEIDNTCILYKNKKIHCSVASGGSGAYDSEFVNPIYTTNKGVTIIPAFIGTSIGDNEFFQEKSGLFFYAIDENGKLLRIINRKISLMYSKGKINEDMLHIYNNNNYIVHDHSIEILDDLHKTKYVIKGTLSKSISYIKHNKTKITIYYKNGIVQIFNTINHEVVYVKYNFPNNSFVTLLPEGFFSGKGNFKEYIHFIDNKYSVYTINQFYDHFFRPDLVKLKLSGDEEAFQKATNGLTYQDALSNPPPKLTFKSIDTKETKTTGFEYNAVETKKEKVNLTFNVAEHDGGGIGLIRIYQEGKLIQTIGEGKINKQSANVDTIIEQETLDKKVKINQDNYLAMVSEKLKKSLTNDFNMSIEDTIAQVKPGTTTNNPGTYNLDIELKSGENEISIEAFNKTNTVTSYRENITINADIPKQKPKLYAIVAGVNEFEAPSVNNLKYSQNDAQAIKEAAEKKMKTVFDDVEVIYLTGKEVTKENILKAAQEISKKAKLDDTVLFYISTHGRAAKGKLYLVPYNNKSVKNWIDFEQTFQAVQSIKALNQIFIIDACESGKANDIVSSVYDSRASVLAKSSGVHMLLATTKGTSAFEHPDPTIKNGVFTHRILEAMRDNTTDANKDSLISILELSKKLKEPTNNADYQYPVIRNVGKDVDLERVGE